MIAQMEASQADDGIAEALAPGTGLLRGQYVIERYLEHGGFGITYLARDSLDRTVVVKECFPAAICCRVDGRVRARSARLDAQLSVVLRHFVREARRLSRLHHPAIVGVHQVFEERGTAYMVLDYVAGSDLLAVLEQQPDRLAADAVVALLRQVLEAVAYVHDQGILHRDISPDNILLDEAGRPTLVDFGAAMDYAARESRALSALLAVKDGYSPQEFYLSDAPQGPASDLYSLGATFYHLIIGEAPPDSRKRLSAVATRGTDPYMPLVVRAPWYDRDFLAAIDRSLELFPDNRFPAAREWLAAIDSCPGMLADPPGRAQPGAPAEERALEPEDAEILRAISRVIAETGADGIVPGKPRAGRRTGPEAASEAPPDGRSPRRFVDIFGNPVEDVEAWLREQERELPRAGQGGRAGSSAEAAQEGAPASARGHVGLLAALLGRRAHGA